LKHSKTIKVEYCQVKLYENQARNNADFSDSGGHFFRGVHKPGSTGSARSGTGIHHASPDTCKHWSVKGRPVTKSF